jgi:hypothetical protein
MKLNLFLWSIVGGGLIGVAWTFLESVPVIKRNKRIAAKIAGVITVLIVAAVGIFCFKQISNLLFDQKLHIAGRIYVITRDKNVIGMPAVKIVIYRSTTLRAEIDKCNQELAETRRNYLTRFLAAKASSDTSETEKIESDWNAAMWLSINHNIHCVEIATTDSTGNFEVTLDERGRFIFTANDERAVGDVIEKYFWVKEAEFNEAGQFKIELDNNDDVRLSDEQRLSALGLNEAAVDEIQSKKGSDRFLLDVYESHGLQAFPFGKPLFL